MKYLIVLGIVSIISFVVMTAMGTHTFKGYIVALAPLIGFWSS
jgi:hypothetical protein